MFIAFPSAQPISVCGRCTVQVNPSLSSGGEEDVLLDVVEILVGQARLIFRERRVRLRLRVGLERPEVMLETGYERNVSNRFLAGRRVQEVAKHEPVRFAVLGLGRPPRPGREEHVGGSGAANSCSDRIPVFEVGGQRCDPAVKAARVSAETGDLPAVGEYAFGKVAAADPGHPDDECVAAHATCVCARTVLRRTWL